jgi:hypothetical protein
MSPFTMWLISCATTPCSSARSSCSSAPRVTAIAALDGVRPAANPLIADSCSSTKTSGTGTPEAMDISSVDIHQSLAQQIGAVGDLVPPSMRATWPPPARERRGPIQARERDERGRDRGDDGAGPRFAATPTSIELAPGPVAGEAE